MELPDLQGMNQEADELIQKLTTIKELWESLPSLEDLQEMSKEAGLLAQTIEQAGNVQALLEMVAKLAGAASAEEYHAAVLAEIERRREQAA